MYMDKEVKRGYNEYLRLDEGEGKDGMMDVALLVMEAGDTYTIEEADKEVACLLFDGDVNMSWDDQSVDMVRPNRSITTRGVCWFTSRPRLSSPQRVRLTSTCRRP